MVLSAGTTKVPKTPNPIDRLTDEQIEAIGKEFQALHDEIFADLGDHDAKYIRSIIEFQRRLAALSRIVLMASRYKDRKSVCRERVSLLV